MNGTCEWVFEEIMKLPFGWRIIQTKKKYRDLGYRRLMLFKKERVPAPNIRGEMTSWGIRERYWPKDIQK